MRQLIVKYLGRTPYPTTWKAMQSFTQKRESQTIDELWITEHWPVFTQGQAGKAEHILKPSAIPIIQTDRGGQITYHGPGQVILYPLLNLKANHLTIKTLVSNLEELIIQYLQTYHIQAMRKNKAPGVYVHDAKIASLGLRIRHGASYHGLSFNVDMDLTPFANINPCGLKNQTVTQCSALIPNHSNDKVQQKLSSLFIKLFNYNQVDYHSASLEENHERAVFSN